MLAAKIVGKPTLFRRLGAMFYDTWLVAGCLLAGSAIINGLNAYVNKDLVEGKIAISGYWEILLFVVSLLIFWGFFCYFWQRLHVHTLAHPHHYKISTD